MTDTIARPVEKEEQKTEGLPPYNVVLLDDNDHSYEYVILMLKKIFGHPIEKGYEMAQEVDATGRVVVATTNSRAGRTQAGSDPGLRSRPADPALQRLNVRDRRAGIRLARRFPAYADSWSGSVPALPSSHRSRTKRARSAG